MTQVKPQYPPVARVNYIQGRVHMEVTVTPEGRVAVAHVISGNPLLAASAVQAVRGWVYLPWEAESGAVEFMTTIDINFRLRHKKIALTPREAERDLNRRVRPPQLVEKPPAQATTGLVRLRVLVGDNGQVVDSKLLAGLPSNVDAARKSVEHWTFRPARWGSLPVPWYLDVDVPVADPGLDHGAGDP